MLFVSTSFKLSISTLADCTTSLQPKPYPDSKNQPSSKPARSRSAKQQHTTTTRKNTKPTHLEPNYRKGIDCTEHNRTKSPEIREQEKKTPRRCDTFYSYVGNAFVFRRSKVEHEVEEKQKAFEVARPSQRQEPFQNPSRHQLRNFPNSSSSLLQVFKKLR